MTAPEVDMLDSNNMQLSSANTSNDISSASTSNDTVDFDDSGCAFSQTDGNTESSQLPESHILTSEIHPRSEVTRRSHDTAFGVEEPSTSRSHSLANKSAFSDEELCEKFCQLTCGCTKANGKPCSTLFPPEHFADIRAQASLLDCHQLDCVLMGSLMTTMVERENIVDGRHKPVKRSHAPWILGVQENLCISVWRWSELPTLID